MLWPMNYYIVYDFVKTTRRERWAWALMDLREALTDWWRKDRTSHSVPREVHEGDPSFDRAIGFIHDPRPFHIKMDWQETRGKQ